MWVKPYHVALFCLCITACIGDTFMKRVYLKSRDSYSELTSTKWIAKADAEMLTVGVRFSSRSPNGQILTLTGSRKGEKHFKLSIAVRDSVLNVDLLNGNGQSILEQPLSQFKFNGTTENWGVGVRFHPESNSFVYSGGEFGAEFHCRVKETISFRGIALTALLGSQHSDSLVGCVTLVSVSFGDFSNAVSVLRESDVESCSEYQHECARTHCGEGVCLELEAAVCDCYGTGRSGPNCRDPASTLSVDGEINDVLQYNPLNVDKYPKRISMHFKLSEPAQGAVFSMQFLDGRVMRIYTANGLLTVIISGENEAYNMLLDKSVQQHSLLLKFNHQMKIVEIDVDGTAEIISLECVNDNRCRTATTKIQFGSSIQTNPANAVGITGCISNVYVDHNDIIQMYNNGDYRVPGSGELKECLIREDIFSPKISYAQMEPRPSIDAPEKPVEEEEEGADEESSENPPQPIKEEDVAKAIVFPMPARKPSIPTTPCDSSHTHKCRNSAACYAINEHDQLCKCIDGYTGKYCQFATFPRSCTEAKLFFDAPDGATIIDVDGSGPLRASVAECVGETTKVIHNMPDNTLVRDEQEPNNALFLPSYRDFDKFRIAQLINMSNTCTQDVSYSCKNAPLNFKSPARTWFDVAAGDRVVAHLGDGQCGDGSPVVCACDERPPGEVIDKGVLRGPDAGVQQIVSLWTDGDGAASMTLGPLLCKGAVNEMSPLRFSRPNDILVDRVFVSQVSFQFKTASSNGVLFKLQKNENFYVVASIDSSNSLSLKMQNGDAVNETNLFSSVKLNNTEWHLFVMEVSQDELLLSVDASHQVVSIKQTKVPVDAYITLGDSKNGMIGCVRSLLVDNIPVNLERYIDSARGVHPDCEDQCVNHSCVNDAACVENYVTLKASCHCKYPEVHSGANCEKDINEDSSISLHGGYLEFEGLSVNALLDQVVLSFRTDQQQALIFFAHDQYNNFIQLYLASDTKITLMLNSGNKIHGCSVTAPPNKEYSDMQWVQIVISHNTEKDISTLTVNEFACSIKYRRELSETLLVHLISDLSFDILQDRVLIPTGPMVDSFSTRKQIFTFVGGVTKKQEDRLGNPPIYDTVIPNLLGCMRGLRIGPNQIDLRRTSNGDRPEDQNLIRVGCEFGCENLSCKHGGHCGLPWILDVDHAQCDCSRTSYVGKTCSEDRALKLDVGHYLRIEYENKRGVGANIVEKQLHSQSLKFAFTFNLVPEIPHAKPMTLLILLGKNSSSYSYMDVLLNKNGSINVGIVPRLGSSSVITINGNFTDGSRHFFVAQFRDSHATAIMVDSYRMDFAYKEKKANMHLFEMGSVIIGGHIEQAASSDRESFRGCISNMEIDLGLSGLKFWPIDDYLNEEESYVKSFPDDMPGIGECGSFANSEIVPGVQKIVRYPVFDSNFGRFPYSGPIPGQEDDGGVSAWIILLILFIILLIIAACLAFYCFCIKPGRKQRPTPGKINKDEIKPLRGDVALTPVGKPTSNYNLPKPDVQFDTTDKGDNA